MCLVFTLEKLNVSIIITIDNLQQLLSRDLIPTGHIVLILIENYHFKNSDVPNMLAVY